MRREISLLTVSILATLTWAQSPKVESAATKDPTEPSALIYERVSERYVYRADGGSEIQHSERIKVLSDAAVRQLGVIRIPYAKFSDTVELLKVTVVKPDGTRVPSPNDTDIDEPTEVSRAAPFYSDLREKHIVVKSLAVGDAIEMEERVSRKPLVEGQFWLMEDFVHGAPITSQTLVVDVPSNIKITFSHDTQKPETAAAGERRTFTWHFSHPTEPTKKELKAQAARKAYDVELTSFASWQQIADWYTSLQKPRMEVTPELRAKTQELTAKANNDEEKAAALFHFVAQQYQYIGVAFGIGRYQPHPAAEVFSNDYGDCKDKHVLLATLLQTAGIPASTVLLHAGRDIDPAVPSPGAVDHVITMVELHGKQYFLDSTGEMSAFGLLADSEKNRKVLIISPSGQALVTTTPMVAGPSSSMRFKIDAKLDDDGTLKGGVAVADTGEIAAIMRTVFRRTPQNHWPDLMEVLIRSWGFGGKVSDLHVDALERVEEPFKIDYQYTREKYSDFENNHITAPTPLFPVPRYEKDDPPLGPISLGGPVDLFAEAIVEVAPGLHLTAPGTDVDVSNEIGEFHGRFHVTRNTLKASRELKYHTLEAPASSWQLLNDLEKASEDSYGELAAIREASFGVTAESRDKASAAEEKPQAGVFVHRNLVDAESALREGRTAQAEQKIQEVLAADPKNAMALSMHAGVRLTRSDLAGAENDLRDAIKADPGYIFAYQMLTRVLLQRHRNDEAIDVLKSWVQQDRSNPQPVLQLAQQLFVQKRYEEARPYVENAIKVEDSAGMEMTLAAIELSGKAPEKAIPVFEKAIKLDRQPGNLNNAAYQLSEHNLDLEEALAWSKESVAAAEARCAVNDLHEVDGEKLFAPVSVAADWDTLGWIYFKLKNYPEAKKYLSAAWSLLFSKTTGEHLDQLYAASGDHAGAALLAKQRNNLQEQRSFHLPLKLKSGNAEFLLLVEQRKVKDVLQTSSEGDFSSALTVIKQLDFSRLDLPAPVVRKSVVACSAYSGCMLVLTPLDIMRPVSFAQSVP